MHRIVIYLRSLKLPMIVFNHFSRPPSDIGEDIIAEHPELKPGPYLELAISDTGHGVPAHELDRIFDPFFTTKEKGKGTDTYKTRDPYYTLHWLQRPNKSTTGRGHGYSHIFIEACEQK